MRDESSGFQDVINSSKRKLNDVIPHLFLCGLDTSQLKTLQKLTADIAGLTKLISSIKGRLTHNDQRKLKDIPALLNEERVETEKIEKALSTLKADPAFEAIEGDLIEIESQLTKLRAERKSLNYQIEQIRSIPAPEQINLTDIHIVYDKVKQGLGDLVSKSLDQAVEFKQEIEKFQGKLQQSELIQLEAQRASVAKQIGALSTKHTEFTKTIDHREVLAEFRTGFEVAKQRSDSYHETASLYTQHEDLKNEKTAHNAQRSEAKQQLSEQLQAQRFIEVDLNKTLVTHHQEVMMNADASFKFDLKDGTTVKHPLQLDVRIHDDGSNGVNHIRCFLYDFTLLTAKVTQATHPHFLLHDGIFEADQDSLLRSLNLLNEWHENPNFNFQYILTINADKLSDPTVKDQLKLPVDELTCLTLTKSNQLLGSHYQER